MNKIILDNKEFYYQVFFKKNKNVYLRIKSGVINITAPKKYKTSDIEQFIIKHQDFVLKHLDIIKSPLYSKEVFKLLGSDYDIVYHDGKTLKIEVNRCVIPSEFSDKKVENFYKKITLEKANELVEKELKCLLKEINFQGITFKSQLMKSRLGSCNIKLKRINLNSILARFDEKYLRAVLIHELVHLNEANHKKGFYNLLLKYVPDYRELRKELNQIIRTYEI
jgi:predicted metal-dependent hydrolase